ncbi:hypothetical protein [Burkholderia multivorans]|uniref:hypothetical protein n=1 Tax=Burkholderia multivorans TaxID=87883 RepID=UPI00286FDEEE|nr:hypothetical protein [Burkholderia multivorans]
MTMLVGLLTMLAAPFIRMGLFGIEVLGTLVGFVVVLVGFFFYVMIRYPKRRPREPR